MKQRHLQPHKSALSQVICASLTTLPEYAEAETICSYVGVGDEVLTTNLVKTALEQGKRVAVPHWESTSRIAK